VVSVAAVAATACARRPSASDGERARPSAPAGDAAPAPVTSGSLPEDPVAGAKSAAEWRRHLEREERERRLIYDRQRLGEHRRVLQILHNARRAYDAAGTRQAVTNAERAFGSTRPKLDAMFDAIDHWGVSSKVVPDYRKLVETLAVAYPNARIAALAGEPVALQRLEDEVTARFAAIDAWLHEAAESDDE
jgi:hypothetical protein